MRVIITANYVTEYIVTYVAGGCQSVSNLKFEGNSKKILIDSFGPEKGSSVISDDNPVKIRLTFARRRVKSSLPI